MSTIRATRHCQWKTRRLGRSASERAPLVKMVGIGKFQIKKLFYEIKTNKENGADDEEIKRAYLHWRTKLELCRQNYKDKYYHALAL